MKKVIFLVVVMSIFGCAPRTSDYYYASLESVSTIEIVSIGKVKIKNLKGNSDIPISYFLKRESYSLHFEIGHQSYFPHFKISVESLNGVKFHLSPRRNKQVVSDAGVICSSYYSDTQNPSSLYFGWSSDCLSEKFLKHISFDVIDENGNLVTQENIPFELKKDGKYTLLDAI